MHEILEQRKMYNYIYMRISLLYYSIMSYSLQEREEAEADYVKTV